MAWVIALVIFIWFAGIFVLVLVNIHQATVGSEDAL